MVMKLNRNVIKIKKQNKLDKEEPSTLPPKACILEVWDLTKEVFSLSEKFDVESRLQRNVINFIKGKG